MGFGGETGAGAGEGGAGAGVGASVETIGEGAGVEAGEGTGAGGGAVAEEGDDSLLPARATKETNSMPPRSQFLLVSSKLSIQA
mmetsp:Transcript_2451/g.5100  ORF Transcript_2451/g.5100 Transcript_2451/m.5100 type:complete len:84 (+) Transcript_2451:628-879(+)